MQKKLLIALLLHSGALATAKPHLILIGVDAFGWKPFTNLMRQGLLPNLSAVAKKGIVGRLSNYPGTQASQWQAIATGVFPNAFEYAPAHKIVEFSAGFTEFTPILATRRPTPPLFWDLLNAKGLKIGLSGWPFASQSENGVEEAEFYAVGRKSLAAGASAEALKKEMAAPNWVATAFAERDTGLIRPPAFFDRVKQEIAKAEQKTDAEFGNEIPSLRQMKVFNKTLYLDVKYALVAAEVSLSLGRAVSTNPETDFVATLLWGLDPIEHRAHALGKDFLTQTYQYYDRLVGRLLAGVGDDTYVIIVSNHSVESTREHNHYSSDPIFVAKGPGLQKNKILVGATVADIAPTILRIYGMKPFGEIDGQLMNSLFTEEFLKKPVAELKPARALTTARKKLTEQGLATKIQTIEKANLARLKAIGYF